APLAKPISNRIQRSANSKLVLVSCPARPSRSTLAPPVSAAQESSAAWPWTGRQSARSTIGTFEPIHRLGSFRSGLVHFDPGRERRLAAPDPQENAHGTWWLGELRPWPGPHRQRAADAAIAETPGALP